MLTQIHIKHFTVVNELSLDFNAGLSVLTGETGAGKSIWIDAIGLALGQRADTKVIRHGEERCDIHLSFDITQLPAALTWLEHNDIPLEESECIIRRVIQRNGQSRSTINGAPCTQSQCREFSQTVMQIHGQHENQALLKTAKQRQLVDYYAKNNQWLEQIQFLYQQWQGIQNKLDILRGKSTQRDSELELLRYQLDELTELNLQPNEWEEISRQHQQMHNAKGLITQLNQAIEFTSNDDSMSASQALQQAITELSNIAAPDEQITAIKELLKTADIHLQEASDELHQYRNSLDLSPENLATIEQRLTKLHDLARKHHVNPTNLIDIEKSLQQQITQLENIDTHMAKLKAEQVNLLQQYQSIANALTESRKKAIKVLNKKITEQIQRLGIEGGQLDIRLEKFDQPLAPFGQEAISFYISTNPGHPLQPLANIVSGGELSRISLAIQVICAADKQTPTLIFDEVDVGIGGKTAACLGRLLRSLGEKTQVLCITHLPQVAAAGNHHYQVSKKTQNQSVESKIQLLKPSERVDEIARMLSGTRMNERTREHAAALLEET